MHDGKRFKNFKINKYGRKIAYKNKRLANQITTLLNETVSKIPASLFDSGNSNYLRNEAVKQFHVAFNGEKDKIFGEFTPLFKGINPSNSCQVRPSPQKKIGTKSMKYKKLHLRYHGIYNIKHDERTDTLGENNIQDAFSNQMTDVKTANLFVRPLDKKGKEQNVATYHVDYRPLNPNRNNYLSNANNMIRNHYTQTDIEFVASDILENFVCRIVARQSYARIKRGQTKSHVSFQEPLGLQAPFAFKVACDYQMNDSCFMSYHRHETIDSSLSKDFHSACIHDAEAELNTFVVGEDVLVQKLLTTRIAVLLPILSDIADEIIWDVRSNIKGSTKIVREIIFNRKVKMVAYHETLEEAVSLSSDAIAKNDHLTSSIYCRESITQHGYNFTLWLFLKYCIRLLTEQVIDGITQIIVTNFNRPMSSPRLEEDYPSPQEGTPRLLDHLETQQLTTPIDVAESQVSEIQSKHIDKSSNSRAGEPSISESTEKCSNNKSIKDSIKESIQSLENNSARFAVNEKPLMKSMNSGDVIQTDFPNLRSNINQPINAWISSLEYEHSTNLENRESQDNKSKDAESFEVPDLYKQGEHNNAVNSGECNITKDSRSNLSSMNQFLPTPDHFKRSDSDKPLQHLTNSQIDKSDSLSDGLFLSESFASGHPTPNQILDNFLSVKKPNSLPPVSSRSIGRNHFFKTNDPLLHYKDMDSYPSSRNSRLLRNGNKRRTSNISDYFLEANIGGNIQAYAAGECNKCFFPFGYKGINKANESSASLNQINASVYSLNNCSECSVDIKSEHNSDTYPTDSNNLLRHKKDRLSKSMGEFIQIRDNRQFSQKPNHKVIFCAHGDLPITFPKDYDEDMKPTFTTIHSKPSIEQENNQSKISILSEVVDTILHKLKAETIDENNFVQDNLDDLSPDVNCSDDLSHSLTYLTNCSLPKSMSADVKKNNYLEKHFSIKNSANVDGTETKDNTKTKHIKVCIENSRKVDIAFERDDFDRQDSFKIANDGADISFNPGSTENSKLPQKSHESQMKSSDYFKRVNNPPRSPKKQCLVDQFSPKKILVPGDSGRSESSARPFFLINQNKSPSTKYLNISQPPGNAANEKKSSAIPLYLTTYLNANRSGKENVVYECHPSNKNPDNTDYSPTTQDQQPPGQYYANNSSTTLQNNLLSICSDNGTNVNDFKTLCDSPIRESPTITQLPPSNIENSLDKTINNIALKKHDVTEKSKSATTSIKEGILNYTRTQSCPRFYSLPDIGDSKIPRRIISGNSSSIKVSSAIKGVHSNREVKESTSGVSNLQFESKYSSINSSQESCDDKRSSINRRSMEKEFKELKRNKSIKTNISTISRSRSKSTMSKRRESFSSIKSMNVKECASQLMGNQQIVQVSLVPGDTFFDIINRKLTDEIGQNSGIQFAGTEDDITSRTILATLTEKNPVPVGLEMENCPAPPVGFKHCKLNRKYTFGDKTAQSSISSTLPSSAGSDCPPPCKQKAGFDSPCCNMSCWGTTEDSCSTGSSPIPDVEIETRCSSTGDNTTLRSRKFSQNSICAIENSTKTSNCPGYFRHTAASRNKIINRRSSSASQSQK